VVGSTALGAYREGRSDIDVVAVIDDDSTAVAYSTPTECSSGRRTSAGRDPHHTITAGEVISKEAARECSDTRPSPSHASAAMMHGLACRLLAARNALTLTSSGGSGDIAATVAPASTPRLSATETTSMSSSCDQGMTPQPSCGAPQRQVARSRLTDATRLTGRSRPT
jgi:hypothetical protein